MRCVRIAAWLVLLAAGGSATGQTPRDRKLIDYAKALPVSQLDPKLPAIAFERWLSKEAGQGAQIAWEVNDCGEQTGSPEDSEGDFPVCVQADAHLPDKRIIVISIAVGTYKGGISSEPARNLDLPVLELADLGDKRIALTRLCGLDAVAEYELREVEDLRNATAHARDYARTDTEIDGFIDRLSLARKWIGRITQLGAAK